MYRRCKREPFDKQRLINGDTGQAAQQKAPDIFFADASIRFAKQPHHPEKRQADAYPENVQSKGLNQRRRNQLHQAEIGSKK